ncbi:MAG: pseudouridine synthase [Pirellulales bacterium]
MSSKPAQPSPFTLFHLRAEHDGLTLSAVLKELVPTASWGQTKQWVSGRHVQVNGNLCLDPSRRVTAKDVVKLWREALAKPVSSGAIKIVYIDEHLVVVEKPPEVTSVRHREERRESSRKQRQPTLEELLPAAIAKFTGADRVKSDIEKRLAAGRRLPPQSKRKPAFPPVFPVHRLDRDTSGLMIFARTRIAEQKLIRMFSAHRIERRYWAVVIGELESQTIRSTLVRDRGDGLRGSATEGTEPEDGQSAVTHVQVLERLNGYTIVRCQLETGRTHQIRIHLSELGHPLCGDKVYMKRRDGQIVEDASEAPRHVLHSDRMAFTHPIMGSKLEFHMKTPTDLARWLQQLRARLKGDGPTSSSQKAAEGEDEHGG